MPSACYRLPMKHYEVTDEEYECHYRFTVLLNSPLNDADVNVFFDGRVKFNLNPSSSAYFDKIRL